MASYDTNNSNLITLILRKCVLKANDIVESNEISNGGKLRFPSNIMLFDDFVSGNMEKKPIKKIDNNNKFLFYLLFECGVSEILTSTKDRTLSHVIKSRSPDSHDIKICELCYDVSQMELNAQMDEYDDPEFKPELLKLVENTPKITVIEEFIDCYLKFIKYIVFIVSELMISSKKARFEMETCLHIIRVINRCSGKQYMGNDFFHKILNEKIKQPKKVSKKKSEETKTLDAPKPAKKKKPVVEEKSSDDDTPKPAKKKKPVVEEKSSVDDAPKPAKKKKPVVEEKSSDDYTPKPAKKKKKKKPVVDEGSSDDDTIKSSDNESSKTETYWSN
jgi:hypothetical protein